MIPFIGTGTNGVLAVRTHACGILKIEVDAPDTVTNFYLQVYDSPYAPAIGAVPKKSWPASQVGYKEFSAGELELANGCWVGLSTTENTYTAQATTFGTVQIEFTQPDLPASVTTTTTLTNDQSQVWSDSATGRSIYQCRIKAGTITTVAYALFISTNAGETKTFLFAVHKLTANQLNVISFGQGGEAVYNVVDGSPCRGCAVLISSSPTGYVATGDTFDIYTDYK